MGDVPVGYLEVEGANLRVVRPRHGRLGQIEVGCEGEVVCYESGEVLNSCPERLWMPRPSVEVLKARLDGALGSLGWSEMGRLVVLCVVGGLELRDP